MVGFNRGRTFKSSWMDDVKWCQPKLTVRVTLAGNKMLRHASVRSVGS